MRRPSRDRDRARTEELEAAQVEILDRLAIAAEYRDDDTRDHTRRVGETAFMLAGAVEGISQRDAELIRRAAPLHDVGKIGIRDSTLLRAEPLDEQQLEEIRLHPVMGARIFWGSRLPLLQFAQEIALCHHERWDGAGYPIGFSGEEIPVSARIVAVADVFDVLTHARPYKEAWPVDRALAEVLASGGTQLDPRLVKAFAALVEDGALDRIGWG